MSTLLEAFPLPLGDSKITYSRGSKPPTVKHHVPISNSSLLIQTAYHCSQYYSFFQAFD